MVLKNARKLRSMHKQKEMVKEIEKLEIDKCGVMETGLSEQEGIQDTGEFTWVGRNR